MINQSAPRRPIILILAVIVHTLFLVNFLAHFCIESYSPLSVTLCKRFKTSPIKGILPADYLSTPSFLQSFEDRFWAHKHDIALQDFISIPPRKTNNFGFDLLVRDANNTDPGGDFFQIYRSGLDWRRGFSIYENYDEKIDPRLIQRLNQRTPFHPPNRYLPIITILAGLPLSFLKPYHALLAWSLLHELVILACLWLSRRWAVTRIQFGWLTLMWLAFLPYYLELYMGQTTFLVMASIFFLAYGVHQDREWIVTLAWTISLIVKPLTLLFIPFLWKTSFRRTILMGLLVLILTNAPYFLSSTADWQLFRDWAFGQELVTSPGNDCFQNWLFHITFKPQAARWTGLILILISTAATMLIRHSDWSVNLALWITTYLLGYAHVWEHHYVLIIPAIAILLLNQRSRTAKITFLILALPSPFILFAKNWNWLRTILYLSAKVLPVLLLHLYLLAIHLCRGSETLTARNR